MNGIFKVLNMTGCIGIEPAHTDCEADALTKMLLHRSSLLQLSLIPSKALHFRSTATFDLEDK